jgi:hypothetical protein
LKHGPFTFDAGIYSEGEVLFTVRVQIRGEPVRPHQDTFHFIPHPPRS